jgi:site-specific DNA recombinase
VLPREEWIEVPVPALVDAAVFEAAQAQLAENRQRKRDGLRGPRWLLQGLTVCHQCGYAFYGKAVPRSSKARTKADYRLRCIGADGYRYGGIQVCSNHSMRADHLEQAVWDRVCALLEQPDRLAEEYRRRLQEAGDTRARMSELSHLEQQISALQRGIGRLIDSYAAGVIERDEFEPRIGGLKARVAGLQEQQRAAAEAAQAERKLTLVIGQVEDFAARVRHSLDSLD